MKLSFRSPRSRGVFANRSWVNQSIAYLRKQGGVINSAEAMAEKVFNLFLLSRYL